MEDNERAAASACVGIRNDGNSCYAAAVMQVIMPVTGLTNIVMRNEPRSRAMRSIQRFISKYLDACNKKEEYIQFPQPKIYEALGFAADPQDADEFFTKFVEEIRKDVTESDGNQLDDMLQLRVWFGPEAERVFEQTYVLRTTAKLSMERAVAAGIEVMAAVDGDRDLTVWESGQGDTPTVIENLPHVLTIAFGRVQEKETAVKGSKGVRPRDKPSKKRLGIKDHDEQKADESKRSPTEMSKRRVWSDCRQIQEHMQLGDQGGVVDYTLFGFVVHMGESYFGHYVSVVRCRNDWVYCNDSVCRIVPREFIENYLNGNIPRVTRITMAFYFRTESKDMLFGEEPIYKVVHWNPRQLRKGKQIMDGNIWLRVFTASNLDPWSLRLDGPSHELCFNGIGTSEELYEAVAKCCPEVPYRHKNDAIQVWMVCSGVAIDLLARSSGRLANAFVNQSIFVTYGPCEKSRILIFEIKYDNSEVLSKRVSVLGAHVSTYGQRISEYIEKWYPTLQYQGLWVCPADICLSFNLESVSPNTTFLNAKVVTVGFLVIETNADVPVVNAVKKQHHYYGTEREFASPGEFYRYYKYRFEVSVRYGSDRRTFHVPNGVTWEDLVQEIKSAMINDDTNISLRYAKNGQFVNFKLPPRHLDGLLVDAERTKNSQATTAVDALIVQQPPENARQAKQKARTIRHALLLADHPRTDVIPLHPVRDQGLVPDSRSRLAESDVVQETDQHPDKGEADIEKVIRALQTQASFIAAIEGDSEQIDPPESSSALQAMLNELRGKICESPKDAIVAYSKIVTTGPLIKASARTGNDQQFRCQRIHCTAYLHICYSGSGDQCHIVGAAPHSCVSQSKTSNHAIERYLLELGRRDKLGSSFMSQVRNALGDPYITDGRIRRAYDRIWSLTTSKRLKTWNLLPGLCELIRKDGGTAVLHRTEAGVKFCGIMPSFCHAYLQSKLFFPVVATDGSFQCGIGRGHLLAIVALTGERTILPLAWGWGDSEDKENMVALMSLLSEEERKLIRTVISDEGKAIISAVTECFGAQCIALCLKHKEQYVSPQARALFWKMGKADSRAKYENAKRRLEQEFPSTYANLLPVFQHLFRWEANRPRDFLTTNGIAESFNSMCKNLKSAEPYALLRHIYALSRAGILNLIQGDGAYTKAATAYLTLAIQISQRMSLADSYEDNTHLVRTNEGEFQVDLAARTCTCKMCEDCGLPCPHLISAAVKKSERWECLIHPRYRKSEIRDAFPEPPRSIDFTAVCPEEDIRPVELYSMKTKRKRGKSVMDRIKEG